MFGSLIDRAKWLGVGLVFVVVFVVASGNGGSLGSIASGIHVFFAQAFDFFKTVFVGNGPAGGGHFHLP